MAHSPNHALRQSGHRRRFQLLRLARGYVVERVVQRRLLARIERCLRKEPVAGATYEGMPEAARREMSDILARCVPARTQWRSEKVTAVAEMRQLL